jgi:hypothetical protein
MAIETLALLGPCHDFRDRNLLDTMNLGDTDDVWDRVNDNY